MTLYAEIHDAAEEVVALSHSRAELADAMAARLDAMRADAEERRLAAARRAQWRR